MSEKSANANRTVSIDALKSADAESLDAILDLLADQRRRYVLHCLDKYDDTLALADLADEVAAMENGTRVSETSAEEVKRIYVSLYHTHVPKLEDAGIVTYSQERDLVALESDLDHLDEYEGLLR